MPFSQFLLVGFFFHKVTEIILWNMAAIVQFLPLGLNMHFCANNIISFRFVLEIFLPNSENINFWVL